MRRGTHFALSGLIAGSVLALIGISEASAACRQQFTNTTCDWLGRNCVNHFKTVCDAPAVALKPAPVALKPVAVVKPAVDIRPVVQPGAGIVAGGGLNAVAKPGAGIVAGGGLNAVGGKK